MPSSKFAPKDKSGKAKRKPRNFSKLPQFWSFSRYDDFFKCPHLYALKHIAKVALPKESNPAFERGTQVHLYSQHYIQGDITRVPKDLLSFAAEYKAIKKLGAKAEVDYTIDGDWLPCASDDFDNAWLRAKLDIVVPSDSLTVIDVKTGRAREEKAELQGSIYGMLALERHEEYDEVDVEFWFVDSGETFPLSFERSNQKALKRDWLKRIKPMLSGRLFPKTPSADSCQYCPFRSDKVLANGEPGECERWKEVTN